MKHLALLTVIGVVAAASVPGAAGCGGDEVPYEQAAREVLEAEGFDPGEAREFEDFVEEEELSEQETNELFGSAVPREVER